MFRLLNLNRCFNDTFWGTLTALVKLNKVLLSWALVLLQVFFVVFMQHHGQSTVNVVHAVAVTHVHNTAVFCIATITTTLNYFCLIFTRNDYNCIGTHQ